MLPGSTDNRLNDQLLRIAREPDLRHTLYEHLGEYCHQCRNRLNSLKLGLYLVMRQSNGSTASLWQEIEKHYLQLEERVMQIQILCRPMSLSRVTLGIDLLIDDRLETWSQVLDSNGKTLDSKPPSERAIASFDVERMGQAFDSLVHWRAHRRDTAKEVRLRWWVEAGYAHIAWEESGSKDESELRECHRDQAGPNWALPMLTRIAQAHGGIASSETTATGNSRFPGRLHHHSLEPLGTV